MAWTPGQSGNRLGRPKGAAGLAKYAAERTNNGQDMLDILIEMATNPRTPVRERLGAAEAVLSRAVGRPMQESAVSISLGQHPTFTRPADWDELDADTRLELLQAWRAGIMTAPALPPGDDDGED